MILSQKPATLMTKILSPRSPLKEEKDWGKLYLISGSKYESEQQGKANQTVQLPSKKEKRKSKSISLTDFSICNNHTAADLQTLTTVSDL